MPYLTPLIYFYSYIHIYCPIWIKVSIRDFHIVLFSVCECCQNQSRLCAVRNLVILIFNIKFIKYANYSETLEYQM